MRIIIAGSRDYVDYAEFKKKLLEILHSDEYKSFKGSLPAGHEIEIVSGRAKGVDTMGEKIAEECGFKLALYPAEWDKFGKVAGPMRNIVMAKYAKEDHGVLIAFWDGKSTGTKNMIDAARTHKLKVFIAKI